MAREAGHQGAPDRDGAAEGGRTGEEPPTAGTRDAHAPCPACGHQPAPASARGEEAPAWREPDDPPLLTRMYRKRTAEVRDQVKSVRFTPTAMHVIDQAADAYHKTFAGFVGDAAYAVALGRTVVAGPEDDPIRPLVERLEKLTAELRRVGNNLNQVARATNAGGVPAYAEAVLARVGTVVDGIYRLLDQFLTHEAS